MKRNMLALIVIASIAFSINLVVSGTALADPPPSPPKQNPAAANTATVDITINDAGDVSIGGLSLAALGALPVSSQVVTAAKDLGDAHLVVANDAVTLDT